MDRIRVTSEQQWLTRRGRADWPAQSMTAWQARERMADLLEEAGIERLARMASPRRSMATTLLRILRGASIRIRTAIRAASRQLGRPTVEPVSSGHRDAASV